MFETGLVSVSFRGLAPREILELCRENGLKYVEWGSDIHIPCGSDVSGIVELQKQFGIECSSYGTYFRIGANDISELYGYIETAKALGTDILRLWCGEKNYTDMNEDERSHIIEESKKASQIAEREGMTLCMECHNKTFTNCLEGAMRLMRDVASPSFRMYWQPNQFRSFEENIEYAKAIAPFTKVIHVFNWEGKNKYPLEGAVGVWKEYLSHFGGSQKLLLEFMPDGRPESLANEVRSLNMIVR